MLKLSDYLKGENGEKFFQGIKLKTPTIYNDIFGDTSEQITSDFFIAQYGDRYVNAYESIEPYTLGQHVGFVFRSSWSDKLKEITEGGTSKTTVTNNTTRTDVIKGTDGENNYMYTDDDKKTSTDGVDKTTSKNGNYSDQGERVTVTEKHLNNIDRKLTLSAYADIVRLITLDIFI